jgi:putative transposase
MQRTIRLRLQPSAMQVNALSETSREFTSAFNLAAQMGWDAEVSNATKLHYLVYYPVKHAHPTLVSDLINQARVKAAEAVKSALALQRKELPYSQPQSLACPPRYNKNTYRLDWESQTVRLSTASGRQTIRFSVPDYASRYVGGSPDSADLICRSGAWWLHAVVTVPTPEIEPTNDVVGVDLGLAQPAVTSNGRFLGTKAWRAIESRRFKQRRALQAKGTKNAKRRLKITRRAQARFRRDCDHVLSKQIVQATPPGGTIVLENLTHIRERITVRHGPQARRVHGWSFDQIRSFTEYKAQERGCTVVAVDPRHTSQKCPSCEHTARNNRRSRAWFQCRRCKFQLHADLVGARNVAAKYRAVPSTSGGGGLPVNQPIAGSVDVLHRSLTCKLSALAGSR